MGVKIAVSGLLIFLIAFIFSYNEAVVLKMTNMVCNNLNQSWLNVTECRMKAINRNKTIVNLNFTILQPVYNCVVEGQLFQKANGYKPWLYKVSLDACRFIKKPYNAFAIFVFSLFREYTNFNHTCPYTDYVAVQGFYPKFELFPHAIPTGDYLLSMKWIFHKKLTLITNAYFQFIEDL